MQKSLLKLNRIFQLNDFSQFSKNFSSFRIFHKNPLNFCRFFRQIKVLNTIFFDDFFQTFEFPSLIDICQLYQLTLFISDDKVKFKLLLSLRNPLVHSFWSLNRRQNVIWARCCSSARILTPASLCMSHHPVLTQYNFAPSKSRVQNMKNCKKWILVKKWMDSTKRPTPSMVWSSIFMATPIPPKWENGCGGRPVFGCPRPPVSMGRVGLQARLWVPIRARLIRIYRLHRWIVFLLKMRELELFR